MWITVRRSWNHRGVTNDLHSFCLSFRFCCPWIGWSRPWASWRSTAVTWPVPPDPGSGGASNTTTPCSGRRWTPSRWKDLTKHLTKSSGVKLNQANVNQASEGDPGWCGHLPPQGGRRVLYLYGYTNQQIDGLSFPEDVTDPDTEKVAAVTLEVMTLRAEVDMLIKVRMSLWAAFLSRLQLVSELVFCLCVQGAHPHPEYFRDIVPLIIQQVCTNMFRKNKLTFHKSHRTHVAFTH